MRFAIVTNSTGAVVREFDAADDYVAPAHKFGADKTERVVRVVQVDPPTLQAGQELQRAPDELTETELRRRWVAVPAPVPGLVTRSQFRRALRRGGLFTQVDSLRHHPDLDDTTRGDLIDFLDAANTIERSHPMIAALAPKLGVKSAQIDDVFRLAAEL